MLHSLVDLPNVTLIMACLDENSFFTDLDPGLRSRLSAHRKLRLARYSTKELADIFPGRVKAGLTSGVIYERGIEYIAELAAGDARVAIALLRTAVERLRRSDEHSQITPAVVDKIQSLAHEDIRRRTIRELDTHKRLLYDIIQNAGPIKAPSLREEYEDRAANPVADATRRKYLRRLAEYDLIESWGSGCGTRYRTL